MGRRFEDPALPAAAPLQVLEEAPMQLIRRETIGGIHPRLIRRHRIHRTELRAHKGVAEDDDALFGQTRADRMDFAKLRRQSLEPTELSIGGCNARIVVIGGALGWG